MTGHCENFFFSVKFAHDLGVIKTKIVSFSKKLFVLSLLILIGQGFLCSVNMTSNDVAGHSLQNASGFFPVLKMPYNK